MRVNEISKHDIENIILLQAGKHNNTKPLTLSSSCDNVQITNTYSTNIFTKAASKSSKGYMFQTIFTTIMNSLLISSDRLHINLSTTLDITSTPTPPSKATLSPEPYEVDNDRFTSLNIMQKTLHTHTYMWKDTWIYAHQNHHKNCF